MYVCMYLFIHLFIDREREREDMRYGYASVRLELFCTILRTILYTLHTIYYILYTIYYILYTSTTSLAFPIDLHAALA